MTEQLRGEHWPVTWPPLRPSFETHSGPPPLWGLMLRLCRHCAEPLKHEPLALAFLALLDDSGALSQSPRTRIGAEGVLLLE